MQAALIATELASVVVYGDLWTVNRFKKHLYEPQFYLNSQKQRKVYQAMYRESLFRNQFCVSDKIETHGTCFNTILLALYAFSLFANVWYSVLGTQAHHHYLLWLHGLSWTVYMMYALVAYRDPRELCFYCEWAILAGGIHFTLLCFANEGGAPWYLIALMCFISGLVLLTSQAARMERRAAAKQRMKDKAERAR